MDDFFTSEVIRILLGLICGSLLGFVARWGRFCSLGAIEDAVLGHDYGRARSWLMAMGIAILGVAMLRDFAGFDASLSSYLRNPPVLHAVFIGGIIFGLGMSLSGTCAHGTLARLGGGDLKSLVTIGAIGISGLATLVGMLSPLRQYIIEQIPLTPTFLQIDAALSSYLPIPIWGWSYLFAFVLICIAFMIKDKKDRLVRVESTRFRQILSGIIVGSAIILAWISTTLYPFDPFDKVTPSAITFIRPLGETLLFLSTEPISALNFPISTVFGVLIGAVITARFRKQFRWEACDDHVEMRRQIVGGVLMGFGGVLALGCTVGQGLSAFSLLMVSAPIVIIGIILGAWFGLVYLVTGFFTEFFWLRKSE